MFDDMFPRLRQEPELSDEILTALTETMNDGMSPSDEAARLRPPNPSKLYAGYTYLAQFIDHDLSFDKRPFGRAPSQSPPPNLRTPHFDLDSLYGDGLMSEDSGLYEKKDMRLALHEDGHDLKRRDDGTAFIEDRRNDSNRIISQLHVTFAKFHNRVVDELVGKGKSLHEDLFTKVQEVVRRHYQWIVLQDFLPTLVGQDLIKLLLGDELVDLIQNRRGRGVYENLKLFDTKADPYMPLEFSVAAFRFGHSMVRSSYQLNARSGQILLFDRGQPSADDADDLRGFRPLPKELLIDWEFFFGSEEGDLSRIQLARPIDPLIALPLFELPHRIAQDKTPEGRKLPYRNLVRGELDLRLPTGQEVALKMRKEGVPIVDSEILNPLEIEVGELISNREDLGGTGISLSKLQAAVGKCTPLWYYILREASQFQKGERLGAVGGRIVAEVLIGLMLADPKNRPPENKAKSILMSSESWVPKAGEYGCRANGSYRMIDFLRYAQG